MKPIQLSALIAAALISLSVAAAPPAGTPNTPPEPVAKKPVMLDAAQIQREFARLDIDKSGALTVQEAQKDIQLSEDFKDFDSDHNALLTQLEYQRFALAQLEPDRSEGEEAEE